MLEKLFILREELLLEATDLSTGINIRKAIERGQVPGVKPSFLVGKPQNQERLFDTLLKSLREAMEEEKIDEKELNKYLTFLLSRAEDMSDLTEFLLPITDMREEPSPNENLGKIIRIIKLYFGNINKKESKEDIETRAGMKAFERNKLVDLADDITRNNFEEFVKDAFAHKAKMTEEDFEIIYKKDGWEVIHVKTFSASKRFACMKDRKSKWCTSASLERWNNYAVGNRKIYVIRSEKENKMYQMDFGINSNRLPPSFKDERNYDITIEEIKKEIPEHVLKAIKNNKGKSLFDILFTDSEEGDEPFEHLQELEKTKGHEKFNSFIELKKELKKYGLTLVWEEMEDETKGEVTGSSKLVKKQVEGEIQASGKYSDGKNNFIYILPKPKDLDRGRVPSFTLKSIDGKKQKIYRGGTIFKIQGNRLIPFSLKSFLQYKLPKELEKLLNDYEFEYREMGGPDSIGWKYRIDLKGESNERDTITGLVSNSKKGLTPEFSQDGLIIYPFSNRLSDYLNTPSITNKMLLLIKQFLLESEESITNKEEGGSSNKIATYKGKLYHIVTKVGKSNPAVGILIDNSKQNLKQFHLLSLVPLGLRKPLFDFFFEKNYFGFRHLYADHNINDNITRPTLNYVLNKGGEKAVIKDFGNGVSIVVGEVPRTFKSKTGESTFTKLAIRVGEEILPLKATKFFNLLGLAGYYPEMKVPLSIEIYKKLSDKEKELILKEYNIAREILDRTLGNLT